LYPGNLFKVKIYALLFHLVSMVLNNFIHRRVIERKKYTINTKIQSVCKLSSGHLCVAYRINCKLCIKITKAADATTDTGQAWQSAVNIRSLSPQKYAFLKYLTATRKKLE